MVAIFADANRARIRYAKEADNTWGVAPTSGNTREVRYTGSTLNPQKTTVTSDEIRSDRMISDIVETSVKTTGDINIEFSAGAHDDFLEGFSYGFWTRPMTFDSVTGTILAVASTSTLTVTGQDVSAQFIAGHRIRLDGFVNPANNNYFQITSSVYSAPTTTITVTETTMVVEPGTVYSKLYDANDVIVMKSTAIRSGTGGASTFDSNGGNAFSAALTAGQLNVGQKIFVDGLGQETGTVAFITGTPSTSTLVTVSDGVQSLNFQFGGTTAAGNVAVVPSAVAATNAVALAAAINQQYVAGNISVTAKVATATVTIKNSNKVGGNITKTGDSGTLITATNFSGGDASQSGIFTIVVAAVDVLTVTPTPTTNANAGDLPVTIKGSMLRNPGSSSTIVPHSFSFETGFEDVNQYFVTTGQRIGTFNYDIASGSILKGSFGFQGTGIARSTSSKFGNTANYTVLPTVTTPITNATGNVGVINFNNEPLSTAVQTINLKGTNNLRDQMAVGSLFPVGIGAGRLEISGTVTAYFADGSLWDKFLAHSTLSVSFPFTDLDSNHYEWTVPAVIFDTDTLNPTGKDTDVMETIAFTAKRDPTTNCTFQIDRFSCIKLATA